MTYSVHSAHRFELRGLTHTLPFFNTVDPWVLYLQIQPQFLNTGFPTENGKY